jgi:glycosyltransferase involved in cell wall biosynthesis
VKVLMVTPHLPPHQAANALLPDQLGQALRAAGHGVRFLSFGPGPDTDDVRFVRRRGPRWRATRVPQLVEAVDTWRQARGPIDSSDVVHVHSNTWVNQVAARLARRRGRPYVLTHYGTEIWHHDGRDPRFRRLNREAHHVTFYSRALLEKGRELALPLPEVSVVYPPVADHFRPGSHAERATARERRLGGGDLLLANVKRLHPLADQATLLEAVAIVRRERPGVRLLIAGTGEQEARLRERAARPDLEGVVGFLGLVPNSELPELVGAADAFVLSSVLEATPTVALEALACGTPVLSTDNPGGVELAGLFGDDVRVAPRRQPEALARLILDFAAAPRRAGDETRRRIEADFRLAGVARRYLEIYERAAA